MTRGIPGTIFKHCTVVAALLFVVVSGLVSQAHGPAPDLDPDVQAFLEAGGSLDAVCGQSETSNTAHVDCAACLIKTEADLLDRASLDDVRGLVFAIAQVAVPQMRAPSSFLDLSSSPRAPPWV